MNTTSDIVLHQWNISPFCVKVQKVLDFKGLPYRIEEYGGIRPLKVKQLSASGKLPVLDLLPTRKPGCVTREGDCTGLNPYRSPTTSVESRSLGARKAR